MNEYNIQTSGRFTFAFCWQNILAKLITFLKWTHIISNISQESQPSHPMPLTAPTVRYVSSSFIHKLQRHKADPE